ncbi:MAG TPA: S53 family peptidase [Terracidiphilus sp.]
MLRPRRAIAMKKSSSGSRSLFFHSAVLALTTAALLTTASAQEARRMAPGTVIVPPSNHLSAAEAGVRAHTNIRLVVPPDISPSEAPPFANYGYETPASLACVYRVVQPIRGCNPNSTTNTPEGGSQTIAIVDAFDDPNAASDLAYFSSQFGLPFTPAKFKVVYAQGTQPGTDPSGGWELEEALDIEYSHAMAPHAMLYLVEAKTNSFSDLFSAVLVATNLVRCGKTTTCPSNPSGKGEISMSWSGGEFATEANYDWVFTGNNVVYVASNADAAGPNYPSTSPNVVSVGGTSTARSLNTGDLIQEIAWSDGGGGLSFYEPTPPYQSGLPAWLTQGARATPDVSADANPNNGVWEYDSFPYAGVSNPSNWWIVGGNSLATPLWAGIINASATASGHFAASSRAELTRMYAEYSTHTTYHANFWDITYGACNFYSGSFSGGGYDLCTGLGSPKGLGGK